MCVSRRCKRRERRPRSRRGKSRSKANVKSSTSQASKRYRRAAATTAGLTVDHTASPTTEPGQPQSARSTTGRTSSGRQSYMEDPPLFRPRSTTGRTSRGRQTDVDEPPQSPAPGESEPRSPTSMSDHEYEASASDDESDGVELASLPSSTPTTPTRTPQNINRLTDLESGAPQGPR